MAKYTFNEYDIRQHLMMQQDIINRMSNNSSNCKTWFITIVTALSALQISQNEIYNYGWLMVVVCIVFWYLDAFYLVLERLHRNSEERFVEELKKEDNTIEDLIFKFSTMRVNKSSLILKAMFSSSCCTFYSIMIVLISILAWRNAFIYLTKLFK